MIMKTWHHGNQKYKMIAAEPELEPKWRPQGRLSHPPPPASALCADPQGVWISTFSTTFPEQQHKPRPRQADLPAAGRPPRDKPILGAPAQPRGVCPQHCLHFHHVWDAAASCETVCMSRECKKYIQWMEKCMLSFLSWYFAICWDNCVYVPVRFHCEFVW